MSDTCKIDPFPTTDSKAGLESNEDQAAIQPSMRFEPLRPMQFALQTPVLVSPTVQLSASTPQRLFTDRQLVLILVVVIALLCAGIVVIAMRG